MIRIFAAVVLALTLTACATVQPQIVTRTVEVPVAVRCRPVLGPEPDYPDTDVALRAAPDLFTRVKLLLAGRLMRIARDQQKSAALQGCAG